MMNTTHVRPSEQVLLQRVRNQLIDYLEVASSFAEQRRYQAKSPQLHVPTEIIEQWADWVGPDWQENFKAPVFSIDELQAIEKFQVIWSGLHPRLPQPLPSLELVQEDPMWDELRRAAALTYACFLRVGKMSESVEFVPPTPSQAPAVNAGVMVYAKDAQCLKQFYAAVLQLADCPEQSEPEHGFFVLQGAGLQVLIHAIPEAYAADIEIQTPPVPREDSALKFFFQVHDLDHARDVAAECGGSVAEQVWEAACYRYCNGVDPEGNIFQLRQYHSP